MARDEAKEWVKVERPWGHFEPISGHTVGPSNTCDGSLGHYNPPCGKPAKYVQKAWALGGEMYACEACMKLQEEWDTNLYDSEPTPRVMTPEWEAEIAKIMFKIQKKKRKKEEVQEEIEPS